MSPIVRIRIRSLFTALAAAALMAGCADDAMTPGLEGSDDIDPGLAGETVKADGVGGTATYYSVTRDERKCVAPGCGGYFVSRVNRSWTKCEDRVWRNACYVYDIDFGGMLGMDDAEVEHLRQAIDQGRVVVRGRIKKGQLAGRPIGFFLPTEAWEAQTPVEPSGTFYKVSGNGRVCIVAPCATFHEAKLNSTISQDIHDLDFSRTGASELLVNDAYSALDGGAILIAGDNGSFVAPDSGLSGVRLAASQVYLRVTHQSLTPYAPAEDEIAGHSFSSSTAVAPDYPRTYRFDPASGRVAIEDAVAPCPEGATCIWSGIVTREAQWSLSGDTISLAFEDTSPTQWSIAYYGGLAVRMDADGNLVLLEQGDSVIRADRLFR